MPPVILTPLSRWKPSFRQAVIEAVGGGTWENTSMAPKSVCVVSVEVGPRSVVLGGAEAESEVGVVEMTRAWLRMLDVCKGCCGRGLWKG